MLKIVVNGKVIVLKYLKSQYTTEVSRTKSDKSCWLLVPKEGLLVTHTLPFGKLQLLGMFLCSIGNFTGNSKIDMQRHLTFTSFA